MGRRAATLVATALLAAGCGSSNDTASSNGVPVVRIADITVVGTDVTMAYSAYDAGNDLDITIDWGDGSPLQGFTGQGEQIASHTFTGAPTVVTIAVTGTDADGNVGADRRSVELFGDPSMTAAPSDTSASMLVDTTTAPTTAPATNVPPTTGPATTAPPTTAPPSPPPPSATAATTTEPPPEPIVIALELDDATITATERASWSRALRRDGERLALYATTSALGNDPVIAEITATWTLPASDYERLGPDPLVAVLFETRSTLQLCADDDGFRSAFRLTASGRGDGIEIGAAEAPILRHANAAGGSCRTFDPERATLGFGGPIDGGPVVVTLTARCEAVQPTLAVVDSADCRGPTGADAIVELREARVTFRPGE